ncbi:hypothetical protein [Ruminococcus sp. JL13D9]|uniref:hypothetical protein n=1 Tax=Ruminococcus sp. JL13D9 TaxID=3233381 RepID=UPI00389B13CC
MTVQCQNSLRNLRQAHLGDRSGSYTEGVKGVIRIEIDDVTEIIIVKIHFGIDAKPCHHHIGDAVRQKFLIHSRYAVLA